MSYKKEALPKPHDFATAIAKSNRTMPKLRILQGYIGETEQSDHIRLFLDAELSRFVDVPVSGIAHFKDFRDAKNTLAPVVFWVRQDAKILHRGHWTVSEDPTTMATGEEGGGDPTTMATGEENIRLPNPAELVINPFGCFV
jgi:hypothetical protein